LVSTIKGKGAQNESKKRTQREREGERKNQPFSVLEEEEELDEEEEEEEEEEEDDVMSTSSGSFLLDILSEIRAKWKSANSVFVFAKKARNKPLPLNI
jgi:hypothetical protein